MTSDQMIERPRLSSNAEIEGQIYDVIIVGCGFAGATAARELRREGWNVLVLEARDRVGGRAWFKQNAIGNEPLEMGGKWFYPTERFIWAEADRYGHSLVEPIIVDWPSTWLTSDGLKQSSLPIPLSELPDIERLIVAINQAARRIDVSRPLSQQALADLDISLTDFLENVGLTVKTRTIAEAYLQAYASAPAVNISALHLIRRVAAAGSVSEFVMSSAGYRLSSGTAPLVDAILADAKADVRLSHRVRAIRQDVDGVTVEWESGTFRGRAAVIALPLNVLKHIEFEPPLSEGKRRLSTEELACIGTKVWATVKGAPTNFFGCGNGAGLDWLSSEDIIIDGGVLMAGYGSDAEALDVTNHAAVQRAIRSFLPDAEVLAIAGHDWRHDPFSLETWAVFRPGQITRHDKHVRTTEGLLSFAGAHTALHWPGFIDGAIESGFRSAREVSALLR
ncbi:FAD-dependent oxidoreductase [Mesorhizobium sp. M0924]|uniref:flavin monoamine oxidase family protein n=1 Tax=unclassified Mesorhizobium TaxID=325217 RepID=UPI0033390AE7